MLEVSMGDSSSEYNSNEDFPEQRPFYLPACQNWQPRSKVPLT